VATADERTTQIEQVALLRDPVRRSLYDHVIAAGEPVSRESAAASAGVSRSLAAFHLDKLVDEGLLATTFRRLTGRSGPGAGRPAKLYTRAEGDIAVTLPARDYELAARVLLKALVGSARNLERLNQVAREAGAAAAVAHAAGKRPRSRKAAVEQLLDLLSRCGYEPVEEVASVWLRNCPFHALVAEETAAVCGMNLGLLEGVLDGLDLDAVKAQLDPGADRCCVVMRPAS
jgi:predicted ArsR family transcriptional regulator